MTVVRREKLSYAVPAIASKSGTPTLPPQETEYAMAQNPKSSAGASPASVPMAEATPNSKSWSALQNQQPPQPTSARETPAEDQWRIEREFIAAVRIVGNTYTVYGEKITAEQELTRLRDLRVLATKSLNTTHNLRTPLWRVAVEIIETANAAEDGMAAMQQGQTQAMYIAYQRLVAAKGRMLAAWKELINETERI
jgi:hypothetical protein